MSDTPANIEQEGISYKWEASASAHMVSDEGNGNVTQMHGCGSRTYSDAITRPAETPGQVAIYTRQM